MKSAIFLPFPLLALVLSLGLSAPVLSAERVNVRGIPADTPFIANTRCYLPFVCIRKGEEIPGFEFGVCGLSEGGCGGGEGVAEVDEED